MKNIFAKEINRFTLILDYKTKIKIYRIGV